jgi:hypothetical protein
MYVHVHDTYAIAYFSFPRRLIALLNAELVLLEMK